MPKGSEVEAVAREMADRIDKARAAGEQLGLFGQPVAEAAKDGRPPRGAGKATSLLRKALAAKGHRMPEDVLAEMAGLQTGQDAFLVAMARAEQLLAWAMEGSSEGKTTKPTPRARMEAFGMVYSGQIRAAEALLPYGLAKVTPEQGGAVVNVFNLPSGEGQKPADPAQAARDVTPKPRRIAPPPLPGEIVENQGLGEVAKAPSDAGHRTEGASD